MSNVAKFIIIAFFAAPLVAWVVMAIHNFRMLANLKKGNRLSFFFNPVWWLPSQAEKHFTEDGMAHYWRAIKAGLCFVGLLGLAVLGGILVGFLDEQVQQLLD
jgi:hypothetical protein